MSRAQGLAIAVQTADIAGLRVARSLLGVAQVIAEDARNVRVNKDAAIALSRRVDELVATINTELETRLLAEDWEEILNRFQDVLYEVQSHLEAQQQRSYLSQILFQERDSNRLKDLAQAVDQAFSAFMVEVHIRTHDLAEGVISPLESSPVLERLDRQMKELNRSPRDEENPAPFHALPPRPALYFGRAQETEAIVSALDRPEAAYVAILGGPGIGKTSLALTVLHDTTVERRIQAKRFFVPCDGAQGPSGALSVISAAFGFHSAKQKTLEQKLTAFLGAAPSLLVLDNFESAWEAPENRPHAEAILQMLCRIPSLSLILTLRGAERPAGVAWTRPFLPTLSPLSVEAGRHVFYSVSGVDDDQCPIDELLAQTENVPLAIVLLANLAQYESSSILMTRWSELRTSMLTRGDVPHRLSSLDVSISLSLHSPRMSARPEAKHLLSLLALLPDGVMDTDLRLWGSSFLPALSTLLQNSLAYRTPSGRIRVLTPIREFMLMHHPPDDSLASSVYQHYFHLADQLQRADAPSTDPEAVATITLEIRNIESVIHFSLKHSDSIRPAVEAAISICVIFDATGLGSADILQPALAAARAASMSSLVAHLLRVWGGLCSKTAVPGDTPSLLREALAIYESLDDVNGVIDTMVMLEPYQNPAEAIRSCKAMLELATERSDAHRMARCYHRLAQAYQRFGDTDASRLSLENALSTMLGAEKPDYGIVGLYLVRLAENDLDAGRVPLGVSRLREALPLLHNSHNTLRVGDAEHLLGSALLDQGDAKAAIEHLRLALAAVRIGGYFTPQVMCLTKLIRAYIAACEESEAADTIAATDALIRSTPGDWKYSRCELLRAHGELALYRGDVKAAYAALYAARAESLGLDPVAVPEYMRYLYAGVLEYLGKAALAEARMEDARNNLLSSALLFSKLDYRTPTVISLCGLVHAVDDDVAEALLAALMLPVHRFGYRRLLGDLFLQSAGIAARRDDSPLAARRASRAMAYFKETGDERGCDRVNSFFDDL